MLQVAALVWFWGSVEGASRIARSFRWGHAQNMKQKITLKIDASVLAQARVLAAKSGLTVEQYCESLLEAPTDADQKYALHQRQALALMKQGFDLGGGKYLTREQAHARRRRCS